ncbi:stalk domain-containing protein [Acetoanaerobium noterae]|uniref:stalk domain-containing protein n=1 Tax=Acetoanaerobium noterae TaxID=745369 RepID=UPI0032424DD2
MKVFKSSKLLSMFIFLFILIVTMFYQGDNSFAESNIKVEKSTSYINPSSNTISINIQITNMDMEPIDLSNLNIRYYYTKDGNQNQNFFCDHAAITNPYTSITSKVAGNFYGFSPSTTNADTYLEVSFSSDAGVINQGEFIYIQSRLAKVDWSHYNQSNDYSFEAESSYTQSNKITVYMNDVLISGIEPEEPIVQSDNAFLGDLTIDNGTLNPDFDKDTLSYTSEVGNDITEIEINANAEDSKASVDGTGTKNLIVGNNIFEIKVTAEDGTEKIYTLTIEREEALIPLSDNANLDNLNISNGTFIPTFGKDTLSYTSEVGIDVTEIEINANPEDSKATVEGTGLKNLVVGNNIFEIKVTAEDGTEKIYTLTIKRKEIIKDNDSNKDSDSEKDKDENEEKNNTKEKDNDIKNNKVDNSLENNQADENVLNKVKIFLKIGSPDYKINDENKNLGVVPFIDIDSGRTMVPLKFIAEAFGAEVKWNSRSKEVNIVVKGKNIVLYPNSNKILVDGEIIELDSKTVIVPPGRICVPLRFISEILGYNITYNADLKEVALGN